MEFKEAKNKFVQTWGALGSQWGINKTMAQIHALLMVSNEAVSMEDIMDELQISRGNASMNLRALMDWGIVYKASSFGLLDMAWHGQDPTLITDLKAFETAQFANTQLFPEVKENAMSTAFSHIFQGGYSSGYYSYKWAEVLDADAFEYFHENGIFNHEIATKFKENVLSKGGTEHPMILYKRFRGQEPKPEALLKRAGLL